MILSPDQETALDRLHAFAHSPSADVLALSGAAGSGKTFLVGRFKAETKRRIILCATTNKAARVAAAAAGCDAQTIHSLLGLKPVYDSRGRTRLKRERKASVGAGALVVVDEASMVSADLLDIILEDSRKIGFSVLFVGDAYQLPPVGEDKSPVFDRVPTVHLTTIHRQALDNPLIAAATEFRQVLDGATFPALQPAGQALTLYQGNSEWTRRFCAAVKYGYESDSDYVRALAWTNKRVNAINAIVRRHLLGDRAERWPYLTGERFIVNEAVIDGDQVILPTDAEVTIQSAKPGAINVGDSSINGWRLTVEDENEDQINLFCTASPSEREALLARLKSQATRTQTEFNAGKGKVTDAERRATWARWYFAKEGITDLRPPFASTIHKAQGSTLQHVFIDVSDIGAMATPDMTARLLYTALTRPVHTAHVHGRPPARFYQAQGVAA